MIGARLPFDVREMPVSVLAYIGDAVYELYVRLHVAQIACGGSGALHRKSIGFVSARSQADAMRRLLPLLTDVEAAVYRRSRNHQSGSLPKNADPVTYRIATGFEGLIGYLYVSGLHTRLDELMLVALMPPAGDVAGTLSAGTCALVPDAGPANAPAGEQIAMNDAGPANVPAGEPISREEEGFHEAR